MPSPKPTTAVAIKETKELDKYVEQAQGLKIATPEDMVAATAFLSTLNKFNDKITGEKEKVTKPLNAALSAERARWKPLETKLGAAIDLVRRAMTTYQTAAVAAQKKQEDSIVNRVGEGRGKITAETAVRKLEDVVVPDGTVATDAGAVQFRSVKKFEVMDVTMLPKEYLLPNETMIREAMKQGKELPGVRYYEEQVPYNSR